MMSDTETPVAEVDAPAPPIMAPTEPAVITPAPEPAPVAWEDVLVTGRDNTQRLAVPGGWLYRTTWEHRGPFGVGTFGGSAAAFVPGGE